jgi:hypothetical protein
VSSTGNNVGGLVGSNYAGGVNSGYATGNVSSTGNNVGGLVGYNRNSGTVSNGYATGAVSGLSHVGGLVGENDASVSNSYATGSVTGASSSQDVGGLVGINGGSITNTYATGGVSGASGSNQLGGLVGADFGTISNSYSTGSVSGSSYVGGLVGYIAGPVSNSFWDVTTSGQSTAGTGGCGCTGLTTAQMQTASNFSGFNFTTTPGAAGNNWVIVDTDGTVNNAGGAAGATFPMLTSEYSTTINNAHQLQLVAINTAANYTLGKSIDASATANGSDVWGSSGFVPIGNSATPFTGTFDGMGHIITNLTINRPSNYEGLFGDTGSAAVIQNVGLIGGSIAGGDRSVGGLVGYNSGTIINSYATGTVTGDGGSEYVGGLVGWNAGGNVSNSKATGDVTGYYWTGGLVGLNYGAISGSYATGNVTGLGGSAIGGLVGSNSGTLTNSYATGSVSGGSYYDGGLVGDNFHGAISNSYATGTVSGSNFVGGLAGHNLGTVSSSYATGSVNGNSAVGGLVGWGDVGTVDSSYATGGVSGHQSVGGVVGLNDGTLSNSYYTTGSVVGDGGSQFVGGLVGYNRGGGTVTGSYATGNVTGFYWVGGLVGLNYGAVTTSYATGNATGLGGQNVGGLIGTNAGVLSNSYATGSVSGGSYNDGGLVGDNAPGSITNSYATGSVTGLNNVGGLVGHNNGGSVSNSYATGGVSGSGGVGGLVGVQINGGTVNNSFWDKTTSGQAMSAGGTGLTASQMQSGSSFAGWSIAGTGGSGDVWRIYDGHTDPLLVSFLKPLTLTDAPDAVVTYNGAAQSGSTTSINGVLGAAATGTNAGFYSGYYSTQQGYDITGGNLTINRLALTATITTGSSVYGSALQPGTVTFTNLMGSDQLSATVSVNTTGRTSSSGNLNAGSYTGIESVSGITGVGGTNASNYTFAGLTGNYTVTPVALTGTLATGSSVYGAALNPGAATLNGVISGDVVNAGTVAVNTAGNISTSGHLNAGTYNGIEYVSGISGADAGNYTVTGVTGNYTVSPRALTGSIATGSSVYGSVLTPGAVTLNGVISGDVVNAGTGAVNTVGNISTSGHLNAGTYNGIEYVSGISGTDAANYTVTGVTGNYTVSPLALTGSIATGSSVYGSMLNPGAVTLNGVISGDGVSATSVAVNTTGHTSGSGNLRAGSYTGIESVSTLTGADAANYTFAGATGNYSVSLRAVSGTIATGSSVYGSALNPGAVTLNGVVSGDAVGPGAVSVNTTGNTSLGGFLNAGSYTSIQSMNSITGADAANYSLALSTGNYTVSPLASVAWIGGATGNWSNPNNWQGRAIPQYGDVQLVTIPGGSTVSYDPGVLGSTTLTALNSSGNLNMQAGSLSTSANFTTAGYQQSGGSLNVGGSLTVASSSGGVTLGNITAGSLSVSSTGGAITQLAGTSINATGTTGLSAVNGSTYYNITLGNSNNSFGGAVSANGLSVNLYDNASTGLTLGNTTATGTLAVTSTFGIGQLSGTAITAAGTSSFAMRNPGGQSITLGNTGNNFVGAVSLSDNANAAGITLLDSGTSGLTLGNVTSQGGALTLTSTSGAITQAAGTTMFVTGTGPNTLTADNGLTGTSEVRYGITLTNTGNNFLGALSSKGLNVNLLDNGPGGLTLGDTTATGTLTLTSRAGDITQSGAITAQGATSLTADNGVSGAGDVKYDIALSSSDNRFFGVVSLNGSNVSLYDLAGLTLGNTTATGALSVGIAVTGSITQAAGTAINASGTSNFSMVNQNGGHSITLANAGNNFVGAVTLFTNTINSSITLLDAGTSGLILGNVQANNMTFTSTSGAITQAPGRAIDGGVTSVTAGTGSTHYNITLGNATNFFGPVSANGLNINLFNSVSTSPMTLSNITGAGTLTVGSLSAPITQLSGTAINVTGTTSLTAGSNGNASQAITLGNNTNVFKGAVSATGQDITLFDNVSTGLKLGDMSAHGILALTSAAGPITQLAGTSVLAAGTSSFTASNGSSNYDITLANVTNGFGSAVSPKGANVSLFSSGANVLTLGNTSATGALTVTTLFAPITQLSGTAINVTGTTSLTSGTNGYGTQEITLGNTTNVLKGPVSITANDISLFDDASTGLILGNTNVVTLALNSPLGPITQASGTTVHVLGTTGLTAGTGSSTCCAITLNNGNTFSGAVTATGSAITLNDGSALTAIVNSTGTSGSGVTLTSAGTMNVSGTSASNETLTSGGSMNVSGTIAGSLTTSVTGAAQTTTFGNTTVGNSLTVSSVAGPQAVTEAAGAELLVSGLGTDSTDNGGKPNTKVTINKKSGVYFIQ